MAEMQQSEKQAINLWEAVVAEKVLIQVVQSLLEQGANPNHQLFWSEEWSRLWRCPPLHAACENGNLELVQLLIEGGAKYDLKDSKGWSPLDRALNHQTWNDQSVYIALHLINLGQGGAVEKGKLMMGACEKGKLDVVKELVEKHKINPTDERDRLNMTPLHWASYGGHKDVVNYLGKNFKFEKDEKDALGFSPYCHAEMEYRSSACGCLLSWNLSDGKKRLTLDWFTSQQNMASDQYSQDRKFAEEVLKDYMAKQ